MTLHAVVVRQPWASLIAHGIKTIETRGFAPKSTVRPGDRLAIVAGKTWPDPDWRAGDYVLGNWTETFNHLDDPVTGECPCPDPEDGVWSDECKAVNDWALSLLRDEHAHGYSRVAPLPLGAVVAVATYDEALPVVAPMTDPPSDHLVPTSDGHLVWWKFTPVLGQRRWSAASRHPILNERTVVGGRRDPDLDPQLPLGDFTPGRYGWMLSNPQRLTVPVPCPAVAPDGSRTNMQGVFRLPAAVEAAVVAQIGGES